MIYRNLVEGRKLTSPMGWLHLACVKSLQKYLNCFPMDALRYDRAFLIRQRDMIEVSEIYYSPMNHEVNLSGFVIGKYCESKKANIWTPEMWGSFQYILDLDNPVELEFNESDLLHTPEKLSASMKYEHLAVIKPITEPDVRAIKDGGFPFLLMQKERATPNSESDSGRIERQLSSNPNTPEPIVLKKYLPTKNPIWNYELWDKSGWDLQPVNDTEATKY